MIIINGVAVNARFYCGRPHTQMWAAIFCYIDIKVAYFLCTKIVLMLFKLPCVC